MHLHIGGNASTYSKKCNICMLIRMIDFCNSLYRNICTLNASNDKLIRDRQTERQTDRQTDKQREVGKKWEKSGVRGRGTDYKYGNREMGDREGKLTLL